MAIFGVCLPDGVFLTCPCENCPVISPISLLKLIVVYCVLRNVRKWDLRRLERPSKGGMNIHQGFCRLVASDHCLGFQLDHRYHSSETLDPLIAIGLEVGQNGFCDSLSLSIVN
ncbi:hypothetical protein BaRGS_00015674 [Batillaria attramentaria]|uniref:Uncharacterized protein n=1 Tax=Batillaria attramentaria TaxID=370345 RepID=A0ABD0L1G6_9CAEN